MTFMLMLRLTKRLTKWTVKSIRLLGDARNINRLLSWRAQRLCWPAANADIALETADALAVAEIEMAEVGQIVRRN